MYGRKYSVRSTSAGSVAEKTRGRQRPDSARRRSGSGPSPSGNENGSTNSDDWLTKRKVRSRTEPPPATNSTPQVGRGQAGGSGSGSSRPQTGHRREASVRVMALPPRTGRTGVRRR